MTGRPDQDVVEGDGALGLKSCGLERVTWVRVYWNRGSLLMVITLVRVIGTSSDSVDLRKEHSAGSKDDRLHDESAEFLSFLGNEILDGALDV